MAILVTIIHVIVSLFLVVVVLLQSGKAADLAGAFGGMGSQTVFGPRGSATALSRATTISAVLFMLTSLTLSILSTGAVSGTPSIFQEVDQSDVAAPVAPAPAATPGQIEVNTSIDGAPGQTQTIPLPLGDTIPAGEQQ